jgi:hypothetical protein
MGEETMQCVVFDIDGTLANGDHRIWAIRSEPKKWDVYFGLLSEDKVIEPIALICRKLSASTQILYCTGRPEEYIPQTHQWLQDNSLPFAPIYHRKKGDFRNDDVIKLELLKEIEADGYTITLIVDDRNRVCVALRRAGYTVAQVAEGDY